MAGVFIAVHQHDSDRAIALGIGGHKSLMGADQIKRGINRAVRQHALINLNNGRIKLFGFLNIEVKNTRAPLVANCQGIAKAFGDGKQRRLAFTLKQGVGGNCGAHLDKTDAV